MTTTMDRLHELIALKRAATTVDALDAYVRHLYAATADWCDGAHIGLAALHIDGLVDHLAHDPATGGTQRPVERSHSHFPATDAPGDQYGPERLTAERRA